MSTHLHPRIVADPSILGGRPVIEGTSVPVSRIVEQVAAGCNLAEVASANHVSVDDVRAALEYAAACVGEPVAAPQLGSSSTDSQGDTIAQLSQADEEARRLGLDPATLSSLGRRLLELRAEGIAAGEPMIASWEELDAEVAERRD